MKRLPAVLALVLGATLVSTTPAVAADETDAPVVVNDSITLWPGESGTIDVLANDSDPAGDDLDLCRLPGEMFSSAPVYVEDGGSYGMPTGTILVGTRPGVRGTHAIDYYVCNHTRLTPATLTVVIRPVQPVDVYPVATRPGVLRVHNNNDRGVTFVATDRTGCERDAIVNVPAHATRTAKVKRHAVRWTAFIGNGGVADRGRLNHLRLDGPAAPAGDPHTGCSFSVGEAPF
ncbi:Ig-like domain-containing protein [Nocardioides sp. CN2-186]|uniref:Ig-like domain-containing protein n=1 Tax=Nocardioides tweenelious TaxID=3156607 RepID=UPI0032B449EB